MKKIFVSNLNKIPKRKFGIRIEEVSKIEEKNFFHEKLFKEFWMKKIYFAILSIIFSFFQLNNFH